MLTFNTDLQRGWRGDRLREVLLEIHLENSTIDNTNFEQLWTFKSCLGNKRTLDYCFVPSEMVVQHSNSIGDLDLGSDHRAVQCCLMLQVNAFSHKGHKRRHKVDWAAYSEAIKQVTPSSASGGLVHLEKQLVDTANGCHLQNSSGNLRISGCEELCQLREKRRLCTTAQERSEITKLIWKSLTKTWIKLK